MLVHHSPSFTLQLNCLPLLCPEDKGNTIHRNVGSSRYVVISEKVYTFSSIAMRTAIFRLASRQRNLCVGPSTATDKDTICWFRNGRLVWRRYSKDCKELPASILHYPEQYSSSFRGCVLIYRYTRRHNAEYNDRATRIVRIIGR